MAEINSGGGEKDGKKVRSKKQNPGVDLTAMVDLAFLLITFFMLTTTLSKPQSMDLAMPDKQDVADPNTPETPAFRTLTLVLGDNDKLVWYTGRVEEPQPGGAPTVASYGKNGIRQTILSKSKEVQNRTRDPKKGLTILIKPSKKSTYKNLVDVLDEMAITQEKTYAIVDITDEDIQLLIDNNLYKD